MKLSDLPVNTVRLAKDEEPDKEKPKRVMSAKARESSNKASAAWKKAHHEAVLAASRRFYDKHRRKKPKGDTTPTKKQKIAMEANWKLAQIKAAKAVLRRCAKELGFELTAMRAQILCNQLYESVRSQRDKDIKECK